jgi:ligand-binding sensor domain-containing protein/signal transduction histidine kinase
LKKLLLIFVIFSASIIVANAQPYYFSHFQVENGLSNNTVLCSLQDDAGFLWFGTKDGLNRFDGYTFKVFRSNAAIKGTIGSNVILTLHRDTKGNIWVGTEHGIYRYNPLQEDFIYLQASGENEIRDIETDTKGNIWFIGGLTLYKYNLATHTLQQFKDFEATSVLILKGNVWVSTLNGYLRRYVNGSSACSVYDLFAHSRPPTSRWIQSLFDSGQGKIFAGTSNQGVKIFDLITHKYEDVLTYNADKTEVFARSFIKHNNAEYWIGTESGIYNFNLVTRKTSLLHKQYNNPYSISDNAIYTFCRDREDGIWVGTYFGGLNYYTNEYTHFEKFFPRVGENSLSGNAVREICEDTYGNLWIGTEDGGLNRLSGTDQKFHNYQPLGAPQNVSASNIHGLLANGKQLLIGTFEHGLDVMDIATQKVIRHCMVSNDNTLKSNFFYCLYKTSNGKIIAGTSRGLYYFDPVTYKFSIITQVPENLFYTTIFEDNANNIWVGTYRNGLYYFNTRNQSHGSFKKDKHNPAGISDNAINKVFQDSDNNIWIATENGGLCRLEVNQKGFDNFTTANGLPSNVIYAMLEDTRKNLWITTSKGLVCMNIRSKNIKVFTKANGLLSDQFNYNSAYKDRQGNLYFGCLKGMIKFTPNKFVTSTYMPVVYLTGLQINNKEARINDPLSPLKKSIIYTDTLLLNYTQSSFSIDFAALSFAAPQMTEYAYKMVGLDKDWTYLRSNRKVYFTKLGAGNYIFKLKANNSNKVLGQQVKILHIKILPPFWASWYAYVIYALMFVSVCYFLLKRYHKRTQEKHQGKIRRLENEKEKEIYEAKIAFFTHISHEIRTPLTLIKGPMEKVMAKANEFPDMEKNLRIMERNTDRLLSLTNQLLDFRKTETHGFSLNFVKTDIISLINDNLLMFSPAIESRKLVLQLRLSLKSFYAYVDTEAMNKILSNLLDNAIKYAHHKISIELLMNNGDKNFTILFKNDGYLIAPEMSEKIFETFFRMKEAERQSGTGIGLPLARYLAELHKGQLYLQIRNEDLNVFALTIPVHQEIEFNL